MQPRVTVLIPVKNGMPYLRQTLASLAGQTWRDFEVMLWDNGSTDGTVDQARRWIPRLLPGRVVADRPLPLGLCRATMVEQARTELIAWADADDLFTPDRLERQVTRIISDPSIGVVGSRLRYITRDGRPMAGEYSVPLDDAEVRWSMRFRVSLVQGTALFRRSAVLQAGGYRDLKPAQDYDLWVRLASSAAMVNLPEALLLYRQHEASVTAQSRPIARRMVQRIVRDHAEQMFPGLSVEQALRLRRLLQRGCPEDAHWSDLLALWRTAGRAARAIGQPPGYFRRTDEFTSQWRRLLRMWARGWPGAQPVWRAVKRLRRMAGRPQQVPAPLPWPKQTSHALGRRSA